MTGLSGMHIVESYTKKFNRVLIFFMRIIALFHNLCTSISLWFIIRKTLGFFIYVVCAICGFICLPHPIFAMGEASKFTFAQSNRVP